ncbi:MAG TPA: adenylate/guanylate cyclase domain-containing protein [Acidimicrobiales bacterium]|nr:adenylate/guanylate cyclase domain-containing protein [Acidimicrobiales bacterium]
MPPAPRTSGARKVVTILFSDVVAFTALSEERDPELLGQLMLRYFEHMRAVIERHGGTVQKFIGDAVMAVFGLPHVREDDALRAVRAALEMRQALEDLNEELTGTWGLTIAARTGVNTGEVIASPRLGEESLVVGDAVNIAARLQQAADPGEILIGEPTYRLVRDAVQGERLGARAVKGRAQEVVAWRLTGVRPDTAAGWNRRLDSALVGRRQELELLRQAHARAAETGLCHVVTVMGPAGIGKSRLVQEFVATLDPDTKVLTGRCLPYGEGITFWPVIEILREATGIAETDSSAEAESKLWSLLEGSDEAHLIAERAGGLLGLGTFAPGIQETFWGVRRLLEIEAKRGPLVVVFEDIHWGESTFLDLVEYLADWMRGAPALLVCLSRPELLEGRAGWMELKPNASMVRLAALDEPQTEKLVGQLLSGAELVEEARTRITEVTEGNPLFVEETLRMLVDDGHLQRSNGSWTVTGDLSGLTIPATIHALLTARLDRLADEERAVIERASVVGRVFWWGAVCELMPQEKRAQVGSRLQSLMRKELVRPDESEFAGEDAFRFAHILMRDAAYAAVPKAVRAELHERFAEWVEHKTRGAAGEYEEILGYHLEQAQRLRSDVGVVDDHTRQIAQRAASFLAQAGRRAFARGDMPAAINMLSRAVELSSADDPDRPELLSQLAFALLETGDFSGLQKAVSEIRRIEAHGADPGREANAILLELWTRLFTDPEGWAEQAHREASRAISLFEGQDDERGLSRGWSLLGLFHVMTCEFSAAEEAWERASTHASRAGDQREALEYLSWVPLMVWGGPRPVEEGIRRCQDVFERAAGDRKAMSTALFTQGKLEAMRGRFDEARALIARARAILQEVALPIWTSGPLCQMSGWVELLAGDPWAAESFVRPGVEKLQEIGESSWLSTTAAILAEALFAQGRDGEAAELLRVSEETAGSEDAYSQGMLRGVRAKILARSGEVAEAERVGREAVAVAASTDFLFLQAITLLDLAEVLGRAGRRPEAESVLAEALAVCERKGFTVGARLARQLWENDERGSAARE